MNKRYVVTLTDGERQSLQRMVSTGKALARAICHAQILLRADAAEGETDAAISHTLRVSTRTIERVRQRFVEDGFEAALRPPKVLRPPRTIDGDVEAHLVALTCADPPAGRARWTLRLLAQKMVALGYVETISHERVRTTLKKTS